jgi:hypothetical protein
VTNLAQQCASAESNLLRTERELERLLDSIYPTWTAFEIDGMRAIDVYGVDAPSPAAVDALLRAGFGAVVEHEHDATKFVECGCRRPD